MQKEFLKEHFLLSIKPEYANKIVDGLKLVELRRRFPEKDFSGSCIIIYSSSPDKAVIGYAEIDNVTKLSITDLWKKHKNNSYIEYKNFRKYFSGAQEGFAISFKKVKKFSKPLSMEDLKKKFQLSPPQSYRYVTEDVFKELIHVTD